MKLSKSKLENMTHANFTVKKMTHAGIQRRHDATVSDELNGPLVEDGKWVTYQALIKHETDQYWLKLVISVVVSRSVLSGSHHLHQGWMN